MNTQSRWAYNIKIERWFRTLKYGEIYLNGYANNREARKQIDEFINSYNFESLHSSLNYKTPASMYYSVLLNMAV